MTKNEMIVVIAVVIAISSVTFLIGYYNSDTNNDGTIQFPTGNLTLPIDFNNTYDFKNTVDKIDRVLYAKSVGHEITIHNPTNKTIKDLRISIAERIPQSLENEYFRVSAYYRPSHPQYRSWINLYDYECGRLKYNIMTLQPIEAGDSLTVNIIITLEQCFDIFIDNHIYECRLLLYTDDEFMEIPFEVKT